MTVLEIIQDAVEDGLGQPRDPIQNNIMLTALAKYRKCGKTIYNLYTWDNRIIDQFNSDDSTYITSFADGVIEFSADVDIVLALRSVTDESDLSNSTLIWPQSLIDAAIKGEDVSSGMFTHLANSTAGNKRIMVNTDDAIDTYRILATKRFVPATVEASYDADTPTATPTDYRVLTWPIPDADPAIIAYMSDELRVWDGQKPAGDWQGLVEIAKNKVAKQEARQEQILPYSSSFSDVGNWY